MTVEDIFSVSDQVVCISGASRGLGKGLARMFAERGAHVVIASYDAAELAKAEAELAGNGLSVMTVVADVSDPKSCASLVEQTLQKFGRIDTMVCNAGIDKIKAAEDYERDEWDQILDVNLKGAYFCAKAAAQAMLGVGKGSIIHPSREAPGFQVSRRTRRRKVASTNWSERWQLSGQRTECV